MSNREEEAIKALVYDNVNVTQDNPLKDFFEIMLQLLGIIVIAYFSIFAISGVVLKTIPYDKQIKLENLLTNIYTEKPLQLSEEDKKRIEKAKQIVLDFDDKYPKTTNLKIEVISSDVVNAYCLPNGTIYITEKLFKKLDSEEKLVFIIAHEMAHYKHKDHLLNLRKTIASSAVLIGMCVFGAELESMNNAIASGFELANLKHSKYAEAMADNYAGKVLMYEYSSTRGGVDTLSLLKKESQFEIEFLSTHPLTEKRIKRLEKLEKSY